MLKGIPHTAMKSKMRYLKSSYTTALDWQQKTGARLLEEGDGENVKKYIEKLCPHWSLLTEVFGSRKYVVFDAIHDTNDNFTIEWDNRNLNDSITYEAYKALEDEFDTDEQNATSVSTKNAGSSQKHQNRKKKKIDPMEEVLKLQRKKLEFLITKEKNAIELKKLELAHDLEVKKLQI